jgi:hypothetical protein
LNDTEFLYAFHNRSLPSGEFRHRGHLRLAWLVLSHYQQSEAASTMAREIRRFATEQGGAGRYHETMTRFWTLMVNHARENAQEVESIDELIEKFPFLLDKNLPYRHWTSESFNSQEARTSWVPPDILPLP